MLKTMRDNVKSLSLTLWLVIFAFIGTTFLVWGWRSSSGGGRAAMVARVAGEPISWDEFQRAYRDYYQFYQRLYGDKFDEKVLERLNLKEKVLQELIDRRLVLQEAKRMKLSVGYGELAQRIRSYPAFAEKGAFSKERYLKVLSLNRLTPERFEEGLRQDLLYQKMADLIKGTAVVSEREAKESYLMARERVKAEYVFLPSPPNSKERAEKLYQRLKSGEIWARVLAEEKLSPVTTDFFAHGEPIKGVPEAWAFSRAAFGLGKGEVGVSLQGEKGLYLLRLLERKPADEGQYEKEKETWKRQFLVEKQEQLFQAWLEGLRRAARVQIEKEAL